jgi:hypothetical protein
MKLATFRKSPPSSPLVCIVESVQYIKILELWNYLLFLNAEVGEWRDVYDGRKERKVKD